VLNRSKSSDRKRSWSRCVCNVQRTEDDKKGPALRHRTTICARTKDEAPVKTSRPNWRTGNDQVEITRSKPARDKLFTRIGSSPKNCRFVCHRVSILLSEGQTRAKQLKAGTNERSRSGPNGRKRPRSLCAYSIVRAKQTSLCGTWNRRLLLHDAERRGASRGFPFLDVPLFLHGNTELHHYLLPPSLPPSHMDTYG